MDSFRINGRELLLAAMVTLLAAGTAKCPVQAAAGSEGGNEIRIVELEGTVEVSTDGGKGWVRTTWTNQLLGVHYRVRTGPNSRATLRWSDQSCVPVKALTELEILPPHQPQALAGMRLLRGLLSFFHRDRPGQIRVITRGAMAGVEGTEFVLAVDEAEVTTLSVIDGKVRFGNEQATLVLTNGQQAVAELGRAPALTAGFVANNLLQWCFYYPGVLDLADLPLTQEEQAALAESLAAYRAGDLLVALAKYPPGRGAASDAERIYYAALLLSVGQVEEAESTLAAVVAAGGSERNARLAGALRQLIAAVKLQPSPSLAAPELPTELLAVSYYEQSRAVRGVSLERALELARQAAAKSPDFGFAWARVAELEFSFGRTSRALEALHRSLALAPRNAQALASKGFLLAARNQTREALKWFDDALAVDPGLGNAWLGRGLCRIHRGDLAGGREDLLVAAAIEPRRALLRNYLGKADAEVGDYPRASKELQLAKGLDPHDPTAWLYSALLNQQYNRINQAVRDLEQSQALNDNRSVYRSSLLLDQDSAVRSANLAAIYRDAGMLGVSVREAARAVTYDYANYSAHLFLANSYNQLRDPNQINLRYETPTLAEYLVANLLAPVGAGTLSPAISQQEYSRLFERDRLGFSSSTEYLSRGAWTESAVQYGTLGNFSYVVDGFYRSDPGERENNDVEQGVIAGEIKQQLSPKDALYLQVLGYKAEAGDVYQYYDRSMANTGLRTKEHQDPILTLGYHHEWSPGVHTLLLGGLLRDTYSVHDPNDPILLAFAFGGDSGIEISGVRLASVTQKASISQETYSTELQQIWERPANTTIFGARFQGGEFDLQNVQTDPSALAGLFADPSTPARQSFENDFQRVSLYLYENWHIAEPLWLVGGLAYDRMTYPRNFRAAPFSDGEDTVDQVSPKAGLIWTPRMDTTLRFGYSRSLGGASLDQSFRLEPTQVAGFNQAFRSIIPESIAGANSAATFETFDISLEQKFKTGTYLGVSAELLKSEVDRIFGSFRVDETSDFAYPSGLDEELNFREGRLAFTADQLLARDWSLGLRYEVMQAKLDDNFVDVPSLPPEAFDPPFRPRQNLDSVLHHLSLHGIFNHPSGLFLVAQADWYMQSNEGYAPDQPGDTFWQLNFFAGYRFPRRTAELAIGILNITDEDYHLSPLTLYNEVPHERIFVARLRLNF